MQRIVSSERVPENESEKLFAAYLDSNGYRGWLFEPNIDGCSKKPDFVVPFEERHLLFEVKERRRKGGELTFWVNPMHGVREEITEGTKKFKQLKSFPCSLVIYNAEDIDTLLEPDSVFGAMLGDPGLTIGYDSEAGTLRPESARDVFLGQGGKMMRYKTGEMQNTTINAIIILEQCDVANPQFDHAADEMIVAAARRTDGRLTESDKVEIAAMRSRGRVTRVRVCENPKARIPLALEMFRGPYDERWSVETGNLKRIYSGPRVAELWPYPE
jgi:hypothetical protein